ncbi:hypothetical protein SPHINGO391_480078 [Sphingomonas aurantiaca]|uniref:Uncharacterized protein n=1 Tax=Sphingomonas aurantiaca TaxID=185949 RepID=A0A5E7ZZ30_9SPHN|nr:hypothetical protein [Sphingomonas aurantiaca]VVT24252.1 hypothetical protein SPHINGO391_480078 [Sphingomonas aurantiaca]
MADVGPALGALSFIVFTIGAILFFAAKGRRPLAKKLLIGGAVVFVVALIMTPTPPPTPASTPAAMKPTAVTPAKTVIQQAHTKALAATANQDEVLTFVRATAMQIMMCQSEVDMTQSAIGKIVNGSGTAMDAYSAATTGERDCRKMTKEIEEANHSPFKDSGLNRTYSQTLPACLAATQKGASAMTAAKTVLDGDDSLAKAQAYKADRNAMVGKIYECKLGLQGVAEGAGISADKLEFLHIP